MNRAVGDGGWEYTMDAEAGAWSPSERTYHLCRRRRWVRSRERLTDPKKEAQKVSVLCNQSSIVQIVYTKCLTSHSIYECSYGLIGSL